MRSHAIAYILKWELHQEAIAVGRLYMTEETMEMLSQWADRIVIVQPHMIESIPEECHAKVLCTDIGEDRWGYSFNGELLGMAKEAAAWVMQN